MSNEREVGGFVVLGASGGIGSQTARMLAAAGNRVWLAARGSERLTALARDLEAPSSEVEATEFSSIQETIDTAKNDFGRLDGVVNCVGSLLLKPAHRTSAAEFELTLQTNLGSAFATVAAASQALRGEGGAIVLMSTAAARVGLPNHEAIVAAKAGVEGLTRSAAATYAPFGVRVNAVAPGMVQTPLTESLTAREATAEASRAMHALGRLGQPEDVASMICWLLHPSNAWVTGQVFAVDGGLSAVRARPSARR